MEELEALAGKVYLPGDVIVTVDKLELISDGNIKFGPGIRPDGKEVLAYKAGVFRVKEKPFSVWIDTNQKRYVAGKSDTVIGIIVTCFICILFTTFKVCSFSSILVLVKQSIFFIVHIAL